VGGWGRPQSFPAGKNSENAVVTAATMKLIMVCFIIVFSFIILFYLKTKPCASLPAGRQAGILLTYIGLCFSGYRTLAFGECNVGFFSFPATEPKTKTPSCFSLALKTH